MFTGIVEELGLLLTKADSSYRFSASEVLKDAQLGDSIAVNGCCLTIVDFTKNSWVADISAETLSRTTLGLLCANDAVNLERPVRLVDRLGGHLVQGHVDGVGEVLIAGENMEVRLPGELSRYVVEKGSIAVDGVSLTVAKVLENGFSVALIPHTLAVTNLGKLKAGSVVNIEVDVMAKYAERLLGLSAPS